MKAIKVDDETYELLNQLAEKYGTSIKDVASRAIKLFYAGMEHVPVDKEITKIEEKIITLKYPTRCKKCRRELKQGDIAYWIRYTYSDKSTKSRILCIECYSSEQIRDKELGKLIVEKYRIKREIKVLKEEEKRLLERIMELKYIVDLNDLKYRLSVLIEHLENVFENKEELRAVREELESLVEKVKEMEEFTKSVILPKYVRIKRTQMVRT